MRIRDLSSDVCSSDLATARRTQPCSGGPCCHVPRLPAPPRPSRVPLRLRLRCVRLCAGGPGGAHPAGRPPDDQKGPNPVTTSLAAALSALELGHLEPRVEAQIGRASCRERVCQSV